MRLEGNNKIVLRTVKESDAKFILDLRTDPELNKHLSQVSGTLEDQVDFIKKYQEKEKNKLEYYFIIEFDNKSIGTVRIYDLDYKNSVFTWGSWIIKRGLPSKVAISSAHMIYYFGFNYLGLDRTLIDVRKENNSVFKFHKLYANFLSEDHLNFYLQLERSNFGDFTKKFKGQIPENIIISSK